MIKKFLANNFPSLRKFKRLSDAWSNDLRPVKKTYAQDGEDLVIWEFIQSYDLKDSVYVDVGANHPSVISNSYLLYRKGLQGILVEPNQELIGLLKRFRPRDIALAIGSGHENTVLPFHVAKSHVMSSFSDSRQDDIYGTLYLPIMRLDNAIQHLKFDFISLLSIDVEGLNHEVLQGAEHTLEKTLLLCIEKDTAEDVQRYATALGSRYELFREIGHNVLFVNKELKDRLKKK